MRGKYGTETVFGNGGEMPGGSFGTKRQRLKRYTCTSNGPNQSLNLPLLTSTLRGDSYITSPSHLASGRPLNLTSTVAPSRLQARMKISEPTSRTQNSTPGA